MATSEVTPGGGAFVIVQTYQPPWSVEMNTMLSPSATSVCSSPVSSQSTSLTSTRMPGRLCTEEGTLSHHKAGASKQ